MARKFDLIPGTDQDNLIIGIAILALVYIGTGGWARERWAEAVGTAGPAGAALIYGKAKEKEGEKKGFDAGFNTLNPALHVDEIIQKASAPVVEAVAEEAVEKVIEAAPAWFEDPEPKPVRKRPQRRQR